MASVKSRRSNPGNAWSNPVALVANVMSAPTPTLEFYDEETDGRDETTFRRRRDRRPDPTATDEPNDGPRREMKYSKSLRRRLCRENVTRSLLIVRVLRVL